MFQIATSLRMRSIVVRSAEAATPRRRPGTPYDFEMLLTTTSVGMRFERGVVEQRIAVALLREIDERLVHHGA